MFSTTKSTEEKVIVLEGASKKSLQVDKTHQGGIPLRALLTNFSSVCGLQSGVAVMHPNASITASLDKKFPVSINWHRLPAWIRNHFGAGNPEEGKQKLLEHIGAEVDSLAMSGKVFSPGDTILSIKVKIEDKEFEHPLVVHNKLNQPLKVKSLEGWKGLTNPNTPARPKLNPNQPDVIKSRLVCELSVTSQAWKLRNDGLKATTWPVDLKFFSDPVADTEIEIVYDVMFGIESLKGGLAYLSAYVNAMGGGCIDVAEGVISLDNSYTVSLTDTSSEYYKWIAANTHEVWVEFPITNCEFRSLLVKRKPESIALEEKEITTITDIFFCEAYEDYVILRERIEILATEVEVIEA